MLSITQNGVLTEMKKSSFARPELTWLRAFTFTVFGTSVLVASYFPLYYAQLGFTNSQIGLLYALGPMISLFANLLWSLTSDRYRTIKKILILLLIGQIIMTVVLSLSSTFSVIMISITIFYFFFYPVFPLTDTIAISTAKQYDKSFIMIRIFGSLGYATFAIVIGYVLTSIGSEWTLAVSMVITVAALIFSFFIKDRVSTVAKVDFSGIWSILKQKELLWFFGCVFCLALGLRMNDAFLTISLHDLGATQDLIGWAMLASAMTEVPIFLFLSIYGEKFKELPLLVFASLMFTVRFLLMGMTTSPYGIIGVQMMHGISFGVFYVTAIRMLTRLIPDDYRATGLALFTIMWSSASGLLSGTFGGMLFEYSGRTNFYLVAMAFSALACLGFASRYLYRKPTIQRQDIDLHS